MENDISMPKNARAKIVNARNKHCTQTVTVGRDWDSPDVEITTEHLGTGSRTKMRMLGFGPEGCKVNLELNGHEARTLYRVLAKHYGTTNAIEDLREGRDEWREVATQNASERIRLGGELNVERERHARTREGLSNVGADLLKAYMVDMPQVALSAYAAGKESMRASAVTACRVAYRTGMTNGFKAAQQLELFSELGIPQL